jgi:hypothetical protein
MGRQSVPPLSELAQQQANCMCSELWDLVPDSVIRLAAWRPRISEELAQTCDPVLLCPQPAQHLDSLGNDCIMCIGSVFLMLRKAGSMLGLSKIVIGVIAIVAGVSTHTIMLPNRGCSLI